MVKHIVLFKLKDEASADEKLAAMNDFKKAIEALPAKIPVIRKIEVGLNINPFLQQWSGGGLLRQRRLDAAKSGETCGNHVPH